MENLIKMLKRHEGAENFVYLCTENRYTIGVGRNVDNRGGLGLSEDEIDYLLSNDIVRCIKEINKEYVLFGDLDEVRTEAVIDAFFCLGATRFRGFHKMIEAFERADYKEAATQLLDSRFAEQTGNRATELAEMIETGKYV
jgi:lysozyme